MPFFFPPFEDAYEGEVKDQSLQTYFHPKVANGNQD